MVFFRLGKKKEQLLVHGCVYQLLQDFRVSCRMKFCGEKFNQSGHVGVLSILTSTGMRPQ